MRHFITGPNTSATEEVSKQNFDNGAFFGCRIAEAMFRSFIAEDLKLAKGKKLDAMTTTLAEDALMKAMERAIIKVTEEIEEGYKFRVVLTKGYDFEKELSDDAKAEIGGFEYACNLYMSALDVLKDISYASEFVEIMKMNKSTYAKWHGICTENFEVRLDWFRHDMTMVLMEDENLHVNGGRVTPEKHLFS